MRARVSAGPLEAEKVKVHTFHSLALSIVRCHAASWGLPPGAFDRPATVREVYDLMLRAQEFLLNPRRLRELGERTGRAYFVRAGTVLERYTDRLRSATMMDYQGVVQYALIPEDLLEAWKQHFLAVRGVWCRAGRKGHLADRHLATKIVHSGDELLIQEV